MQKLRPARGCDPWRPLAYSVGWRTEEHEHERGRVWWHGTRASAARAIQAIRF